MWPHSIFLAQSLQRRRHHDEESRTWEPLLQLTEDVPVMVQKYVDSVHNATLTRAHQDCLAMLAADPDATAAPDTTRPTLTAQRAAERTRAEREAQRTHYHNENVAGAPARPTT